MNNQVSFERTDEERVLIGKCVQRMRDMFPSMKRDRDNQGIEMDLTAVNANGCPIDFQKLLDAPDNDFIHDIVGIVQTLDRNTGKLTDHFSPKSTKADPRLPDVSTTEKRIAVLEAILDAFEATDQDKRCNLCNKESFEEPHDEGCPFALIQNYRKSYRR